MYEIEKDILDVLKKHGYKTRGVQQLDMRFDVGKIPEIHVQYLFVEEKKT